jgi:hypothetical protein
VSSAQETTQDQRDLQNDKKNYFVLSILVFLLLPEVVSADVAWPLSIYTIPLIPVIVLIEALVFWLIANIVLKDQIGFWKIILVILIANIITSLLGTFIPLSRFTIDNFIWIGVTFLFSVLIEWVIYLQLFKKIIIKNLDLLAISFVGNAITYTLLVLFQLI